MSFWEYELRAETLCLGERLKGALFRPCDTHAIRYSAITGALREYFGCADLHAAGCFIDDSIHNQVGYLTYSPRDDLTGVSKLPLTIQFLTDVLGRVIIKVPQELPKSFETSMGAMKSQGMGRCQFQYKGLADMETVRGVLLTRLPVHRANEFNVQDVVAPVYGYLFEPTSPTSGEYVLSWFEGSVAYGPKCLVKGEE